MAQQAKVQKTGQHKFEELALNLLVSATALVLAIVTGGIIIAPFGNDPFQVYGILVKGAFGTPMVFTQSLIKSVPLLLAGLAVALVYKCMMLGISAEGQLLMGAITARIVGYALYLPATLNTPIVLAAPMLAGTVWVFFLTVLKQRADVNMVISIIMLNYVGRYPVQYLILGPFKEEGTTSVAKAIAETAGLPKLFPSPFVLSLRIVTTLTAVVLVYILLNRTSFGYETCAVGLNKNAAYTNGVNVERNVFLTLLMSGAFAGLAGEIEVTGTMGKVVNGFSANYGFGGIPVVLIAHNNPFTIVITAFLMGGMRSGSPMVQSSVDVSENMVDIIQGLVIVFLCAESVIRCYIKRRRGGE